MVEHGIAARLGEVYLMSMRSLVVKEKNLICGTFSCPLMV